MMTTMMMTVILLFVKISDLVIRFHQKQAHPRNPSQQVGAGV